MKYLASALALLLGVSAASAAVTPNTYVAPQTPRMAIIAFVQGTDAAGTAKSLYTAGANGSKCLLVLATSSDASAHAMALLITRAGISMTMNVPSMPAYAGLNSTPTILFGGSAPLGYPSDSDGNPYLYLQSGDQLQVYYSTALGTGGAVYAQAQCADF